MADIRPLLDMDNCMSTMNGGNLMFTPLPGRRTRTSLRAKSFKHSHQSTLGSSPALCNGQRKTLQVIQPAVGGKPKLVETTNKPKSGKRKHKSDALDKPPIKVPKCELGDLSFPIYEDPKSTVEGAAEPQKPKTADEEAWELMVQEPAPRTYWKDLAEERRVALGDALRENEQLHETITELRTENGRLQEMAGQAEYLASVLQNIMDGKELDQDTTDSDKNSTDSDKNSTDSDKNSTDSDKNYEENGPSSDVASTHRQRVKTPRNQPQGQI